MNTIDKLTEIFKEFPGIGERQAKRFVYFLMFKNRDYTNELVDLIGELKKGISQCNECFRFFLSPAQKKVCDICNDPNHDSSLLMIVEKDSDLESVKKSGVYDGRYFILGGLVPIVEKNTKRRVRVNELLKKVERELRDNGLKEIILAFSLNPEGNNTDTYIREQLEKICESSNIKISSLGRGLSTGTELEYSDNDTLKNALKNRQ